MLLYLQVVISLYVSPKQIVQELEGPHKLLPPFEDEHYEWTLTNRSTPIFPKDKPMFEISIVMTHVPSLSAKVRRNERLWHTLDTGNMLGPNFDFKIFQ